MSGYVNCCVRILLILTRTWFAFGLHFKTMCDSSMIIRSAYSFIRLSLVFAIHRVNVLAYSFNQWQTLLLYFADDCFLTCVLGKKFSSEMLAFVLNNGRRWWCYVF
jgi:hypothetical protein